MKQFYLAAFTLGLFFAMSSLVSAQRVGGYKAIGTDDNGVKAAAEFAVETQAEKSGKEMSLAEIVKAERQVVAGSNYRLCMQVNSEGGEGQDDVTITVQAVVYVDLKGNRKLTSWAISDCGDE